MPARILIVEDNPDLLTILKQLLSDEYDVVAARRGEDAVVMARSFKPDIVLLDLQLPGIDGIETGKWIKQEREPEHVPIIVLTALAGAAEAKAILASGCCDAYMAKPAPLTAIREKVQELLNIPRAA